MPPRWPFSARAFHVAFSYSVLQHFGSQALERSLGEIRRVLRDDGRMRVQMANALGIRSLYHQARRRFGKGKGFDVRYRTPQQLLTTFKRIFGDVSLAADCFLGLGIQSCDRDLLPPANRLIVDISEALKALSHTLSSDAVLLPTACTYPHGPCRPRHRIWNDEIHHFGSAPGGPDIQHLQVFQFLPEPPACDPRRCGGGKVPRSH